MLGYLEDLSLYSKYLSLEIILILNYSVFLVIAHCFVKKYEPRPRGCSLRVHHPEHRGGHDSQLSRLTAHILLYTGIVAHSTHSAMYIQVYCTVVAHSTHSAIYRYTVVAHSTHSALYRYSGSQYTFCSIQVKWLTAHILQYTGIVAHSTYSAIYIQV